MKESKEAIIGAIVIGKLVVEVLKDGAQITDAITLFAKMNEPDIKAKVDAAIADINLVEGEFKVAKFSDYIELLVTVLPEFNAIVEAVQASKK